MCGIVGHIGWSPVDLGNALRAIRYRGPDDIGTWSGRAGDQSVSLGSVRLSILDLTAAGHQPMANEDGSLRLVFNGEIYNYPELRAELEAAGHVFRSHTDSEAVLHCYEQWGDDFLHGLRGMFGFALWDARRERLVAARDRLGIKPLFWSEEGGTLAFGSEIKALLALGVSREMDHRGLEGYLRYLYVPPPLTMFRHIRRLAPAHWLVWEKGVTRVARYWRPPSPRPDVRDAKELALELREILDDVVRHHLASDVPLGVFLSGGLDSSTIVSFMARRATAPIRTFCMAFGDEEQRFDERQYARAVADHFRTEHEEIPVRPDVTAALPTLVEHFDEPFGNPTALLVHLLCREARKQVTVALSGDGGDEAFMGYPRYQGAWLLRRYRAVPSLLRRGIARGIAPLIPESTRGLHGLRRAREFLSAGALPVEAAYESWIGYYSNADLRSLLRSAPAPRPEPGFIEGLFQEAVGADDLDRISYVEWASFLPENVLQYADRMSMAHSLEMRVPFCDHRLVEFMASLPARAKMTLLQPKKLLRDAVRDLLPEAVMSRKKLGFNPPMGMWLKAQLRPLVEEYLSPHRLDREGFLRKEKVQQVIAAHMSGKRDYSLHIWGLLVFEKWLEMYQGAAA
jgi:asparagine synthase (glutamine-hydrolysing)